MDLTPADIPITTQFTISVVNFHFLHPLGTGFRSPLQPSQISKWREIPSSSPDVQLFLGTGTLTTLARGS